jgi:hypothetical protein
MHDIALVAILETIFAARFDLNQEKCNRKPKRSQMKIESHQLNK